MNNRDKIREAIIAYNAAEQKLTEAVQAASKAETERNNARHNLARVLHLNGDKQVLHEGNLYHSEWEQDLSKRDLIITPADIEVL